MTNLIKMRFDCIVFVPDEYKFEPITAESLKNEKAFLKVMKKHLKELESLRKRQQKERNLVQKSQCGAIEKIVKNKGRYVTCHILLKLYSLLIKLLHLHLPRDCGPHTCTRTYIPEGHNPWHTMYLIMLYYSSI